jgi:hypothetical protein
MKYAVEMGSGGMIYTYTKFHEDWFSHSEVSRGGIYRPTESMEISLTLVLFSFQDKKSSLKTKVIRTHCSLLNFELLKFVNQKTVQLKVSYNISALDKSITFSYSSIRTTRAPCRRSRSTC